MQLRIYQVDAFTEKVFGGNPAAVVPLDEWLPDELLQNIAKENNLSETAFFVKNGDRYLIRWFTPTVEVDLCGHATLATAHVLFQHEGHLGPVIQFYSPRSGNLKVSLQEELMTLDFPKDEVNEIPLNEELKACFSLSPVQAFRGKSDVVLVFQSEMEIRNIQFDLAKIEEIPARGVIVTAKGEVVDFVSRFFGPQVGVPEDPVTGSAHTSLIPIWAEKLGKTKLKAKQLSARGGELNCELLGHRVAISGKAVTYLEGKLFI
ncbi:PhzF family phenazine biosynthesis protein [Cecembia calidifontis]|jgi:PhzF family phenazine biosynthesis protein|uniref:PhzF family phenazine biosynthesis protein n=1 Tax=Cecembia calidifontis TaxID=1187080 RepID=A0A4Q7PDR0_9BACT|nr:PhzF family phenazine biosynthesis protein [Cecembia calidifontis]RZS97760.1 PhzF family phenazine biosynthesis protein [Cecembia calidifontis]